MGAGESGRLGEGEKERLTLAQAVARAVELGIRLHGESSPVHRWEEIMETRAQLPPTKVEEIALWAQEEWLATGGCDLDAAAIRWNVPPSVLLSELHEYFRRYCRRSRQN